ncbi:hypothetical protein ACSUZJ_19925 [Telluria sp. B2]
MTFKLKSMPYAISCLVASGALVSMGSAMAQQAPAQGQAMQRVVVTGSLISRADTETPTRCRC